jgi:hypothetical protein
MRSGAEGGRCPHCKAEVPKDHGRVCLDCGGSLQKRYLAIGCLTSKPMILIAVGLPLWLAGGDEAPATETQAPRSQAVERADTSQEPATDPPRSAGIAAPR